MRSVRLQLALCAAAAALVRIAAFEVGPLRRADERLMATVQLAPRSVPRELGAALLTFFDPAAYALLLVAVVGAAFARGRRLQAVLAATVMVGASVTTQLLKLVFAQHRPGFGSVWLPPTAWPSGHTTAAAALAVALVVVTPRARRRAVAAAGAVLTLLVGVALVTLGRHYPSDVLGALCVAAGWAAAAFAAEARLSSRARPAGPSRARAG